MAVVGEKLSTILAAIRSKLMTDLGWPAERVRIGMRMNVPFHAQADQYIKILPLAQPHDQGHKSGHGRRGTVVNGKVNVYLRQRMGTDDWYGDEKWLLNATPGSATEPPGFLDTLNLIEDSLDLYNPDSVLHAPKKMLFEPIHATFNNEVRKDYDDPTWGEGMVELDVKYIAYRTGV